MVQVAEVSPKSTAAGVRHFAEYKCRALSLETAGTSSSGRTSSTTSTTSSSRFQLFLWFRLGRRMFQVAEVSPKSTAALGRSASLRGI
jgi:hypothetical protein